MNVIEEVKKYVKEESEKDTNPFTIDIYYTHIAPMVGYSKRLAKKISADEEIVEIAAWLHDIGSLKGEYETHHIAGAKYAEEFLKKLNYPAEKIEKIKHCIITHRGSIKVKRETIEAECIASADGMSHFDNITSLLNLALVIKKLPVEDARIFSRDKLQRFWDKMIPEAKEMIKEKYEAAMLLLNGEQDDTLC